MIKLYWYLFRFVSFFARPLSNLTEFFRSRWEDKGNQYWVDHPLEYEAMAKGLRKLYEDHIEQHKSFLDQDSR